MTAVFRMVISKLRSRKLQTGILSGSSFLLSFFGLGILLLCFALEPSFNASYQKLGAPNLCISVGETEADETVLKTFLDKLSYVEKYEISKRYLINHVELAGQTMDFAYLASSDAYSPPEGQVLINPAVPYTVCGDVIRFRLGDRTAEFCVGGVVEDPVNSAPENSIPYFYISRHELNELSDDSEKGGFFIELYMETENRQEERVSEDFETYFGVPFSGEFYTMNNIRRSFLFRYDMIKDFMVFFFAFLFLIVFILLILMTQMEVHGDTHVIGTLQSMGFTDGKICLIYILRSLFVAVPCGMIGMTVCGISTGRWLDGMFTAIGEGVFLFRYLFVYGLLVMIVMCLIVAISVGIPTIQTLHRLSEDSTDRKVSSRYDKGLYLFRKPAGLCPAMGLHKCMRQKTESLLILCLSVGIGALGLTAFYLINGVGQADEHLADWGIVDMDIYVARKTSTDEGASGLLDWLEKAEEVDYYYAALSDEVVCRIAEHGEKKRVLGEIYDRMIPEQLSFTFLQGRNPQNEREVAVGINFAEENQVGMGDELILLHDEKEIKLSVVGIYPSYKSYANSVRVITPDIQDFFGNRAEGYYSIVLKEGEDAGLYAAKLEKNFEDFYFYPMQRSTTRFVKNLLYPLTSIMTLLLAIYLFLIILLKKWMYLECAEEFVLWYHIGMTKKEIEKIVCLRFMIPILTGSIIAVPLSIYGFPVWMHGLAKRLGLLKLPVYPNIQMVLAAVFLLLTVGFLAVCRLGNTKGKILD